MRRVPFPLPRSLLRRLQQREIDTLSVDDDDDVTHHLANFTQESSLVATYHKLEVSAIPYHLADIYRIHCHRPSD